MAPEPSLTKTQHHSTYPAIDPRRAELSCRGKTVVVTDGGSGVGRAVAVAFAHAQASHVALIGRTESTLHETARLIVAAREQERSQSRDKANTTPTTSTTNVTIAVADVSNAESLGRAAHEIRAKCGAWDVLVHNAGFLPTPTTVRGADEDDWWRAFEVNVRPLQFVARHFFTKARVSLKMGEGERSGAGEEGEGHGKGERQKEGEGKGEGQGQKEGTTEGGPTFINISAASAYAEDLLPLTSAYSSSKLAAARLCDFLAGENPSIGFFNVVPGTVETEIMNKLTGGKDLGIELDDAELLAGFCVWCTSAEAGFLRGRHVWASWDVEEMMERRQEILDSNLLRLTLDLGAATS